MVFYFCMNTFRHMLYKLLNYSILSALTKFQFNQITSVYFLRALIHRLLH